MDEVKAWWSSAKFSGKFNDKDIAMIDSLIAEVNLMQTQKTVPFATFGSPAMVEFLGFVIKIDTIIDTAPLATKESPKKNKIIDQRLPLQAT